ncbi:MAG: hypothetical protein GX055_09220 [Desulfovibrionales bacterium]|nr:hypothetical protein [Desulfovibrionales bacterium]
MTAQIFSFPWLHPLMLACPEDVSWLDPGVDMQGQFPRYRPQDLPFSSAEVRRLLHEYQQFGDRFAKPADMRTYQAVGLENFYSDTSMDILSQLRSGSAHEQTDPQEQRKQAQLVLAMALLREEHFIAMREQNERFVQARAGFADVLGLDEVETFVDQGVTDEHIVPRAHIDLPWKRSVPSLLLLLPAQAELFVADPDIVRELRACGVEFSPVGSGRARGLLDVAHISQLCDVVVERDAPLPVSVFVDEAS